MLAAILRDRQGSMTQEEYAARLGIAQGTLSLIYSGKRGVGTDVLRAFLRAYPDAAKDITAALSAPAEGEKAAVAV